MLQRVNDPQILSAVAKRRALRALLPARRKRTRVARGDEQFDNDHQLRACAVLSRLLPALTYGILGDEDVNENAEVWTPERIEALERLERSRSRTAEDC